MKNRGHLKLSVCLLGALVASACVVDKTSGPPVVDAAPPAPVAFTCSSLKLGTLCSADSECAPMSGSTCNKFETPPRCRKGGPGTECPAAIDCGKGGYCLTTFDGTVAVFTCSCEGDASRMAGASGAADAGGQAGQGGAPATSAFACTDLKIGTLCTSNDDCNPTHMSICNGLETPSRCRKGGPGESCPPNVDCGKGGSCTTLVDNGNKVFSCVCNAGGAGGNGAAGAIGNTAGRGGAGATGNTAGRGGSAGAAGRPGGGMQGCDGFDMSACQFSPSIPCCTGSGTGGGTGMGRPGGGQP